MAWISSPAGAHDPEGGGHLRRLHARHAERLRTAARWLGLADADRDEAVARSFAIVGAAVPGDSAIGWAALMRALARAEFSDAPPEPRTRAEAALLGFLAGLSRAERAVFALAELGGFDAVTLAEAIGAPPESGQALIVGLRRAFAGDPRVIAAGGPAAVLTASLAVDRAPPGWRATSLQAIEDMSRGTGVARVPREAIVAIALAVVVLAALLWPGKPAPAQAEVAAAAPSPAPVYSVARPEPVVSPEPGPPLLAAPTDVVKKTDAGRPVVRKRARGGRSRASSEALAKRAEEAAARDPGNVIVELEMLGAAQRALTSQPGQALAYADQHAREYPGSQLAGQRAEIRVRALCKLGRAAEARAEAQRRPTAKVQAALRETCGG